MPGRSNVEDDIVVGWFSLTIDDVDIGTFMEVHGLQVEVKVESFAEGGENGFEHQFPGRVSWPNITFKRGLTNSNNLFEWISGVSGEGFAAKSNKLTRSTGTITLIDRDGHPIRKWNIEGAFPVRWSGPDLVTGSTSPNVEELEITHHGFRAG